MNEMKENIENVEKSDDSDVRYFDRVPFCNYCTATWGPQGFVNIKTLRCIWWMGGDPLKPVRWFPNYDTLKPEDKEYQTALKSTERYTKEQVLEILLKKAYEWGFEDTEYIRYIVDWLFK
ncbi:MAG: hypothetical protein QW578_08155 [Thermoplasmatales archaeon]